MLPAPRKDGNGGAVGCGGAGGTTAGALLCCWVFIGILRTSSRGVLARSLDCTCRSWLLAAAASPGCCCCCCCCCSHRNSTKTAVATTRSLFVPVFIFPLYGRCYCLAFSIPGRCRFPTDREFEILNSNFWLFFSAPARLALPPLKPQPPPPPTYCRRTAP